MLLRNVTNLVSATLKIPEILLEQGLSNVPQILFLIEPSETRTSTHPAHLITCCFPQSSLPYEQFAFPPEQCLLK